MTCCGVQSTTAQDRKRSGSRIYETVDLKTRDGLKLKAYYFESEKEKKAVPVLLVHAWEGQSSQYFPLYKALHAAGHAVLVVDYRGHGKSDRTIRLPNGREKELTPKQMGRRDVEAIVQMDLEAAKGFLKEKNNDGKLNLNALVVAGVGEGCVMAVQWAVIDWKFPSVGRVKQGQDVKGLVLISPKKLVKGISIEPIYNNRALVALPIMVIGSEQSRDASDTRQIIKRIQGMKRRFGRGNIERFDEIMAPTTLVGASLINGYDKVVPAVVDFVDREIKVDDEVNRWVARE
ncbi:MAG: alpha/beta fold hydrolase [Planctomycetota bacterium]